MYVECLNRFLSVLKLSDEKKRVRKKYHRDVGSKNVKSQTIKFFHLFERLKIKLNTDILCERNLLRFAI